MIILTTTSDKIQVALTNTASTQLQCFASYRDTTTSSITPGRNVVSTNNTSQVDLVGSPSTSTQRIVDYISVYNSDTANAEVTIRFFDGTTGYKLITVKLSIGEKLEYQDGIGFKVIGNGYGVKTITTFDGIINNTSFNTLVLRRDIVNIASSNESYVDIPNLSIPVRSGKKYWFRFVLFYNANATTTGSRFNIYGVSSQSFIYYQTRVTLTSSTETALGGYSAYNSISTSGATSAATTGNVALLEGFIQADYDGILLCNFGVEVAGGTITVKENSFVQYQQVL